MSGEFPRTTVGGLSVSRMIIGSNWFLGYSHTSKAKDDYIRATMTAPRIADVLEVFLRAGVDTTMGMRPTEPQFVEACKMAEDRTGRRLICIGTPHLNLEPTPAAADENARILDAHAALGCQILMPHQGVTDALVDRTSRTIRRMDEFCAMIRQRGMIPGLSTHMPETPVYADETNLDVETYIQIYNAAGFLMQVEVDWVHRIIANARKPVITIKPMAAGRLLPLVGLAFAWATIRDMDMVTVGVMTPDEARECIEISQSILSRQPSQTPLQSTRSKESIKPRVPAPGSNAVPMSRPQ